MKGWLQRLGLVDAPDGTKAPQAPSHPAADDVQPADPEAIAAARQQFEAACAALGPDDIALDCGANVGVFTEQLARGGATVYAFEPNPHAFAVLREKFGGMPNVVLAQQAVHHTAEKLRLYFHRNAGEDPVHWSTGSSLLAFKGNVDPATYAEVEAVDLCAFVAALPRPVAILKMDIEGAEVPILKRLIDSGLHRRVRRMFVETHERKIPELRPGMAEIRAMIAAAGITSINLEWE